jgi:adenylate cyclase
VKVLVKVLRYPAVGGVIVSLLTFGIVLGLAAKGWLQRPELIVYDFIVGQRAKAAPATDSSRPDRRGQPFPHIVICGMTEKDLIKYGHPLDDAKLSALLRNINDAGARVIGMDIWRDLPEPRSGKFYPLIEETLRQLDNVVAIEKIRGKKARGIKPPPALVGHPERVAPNNVPNDQVDGICRTAYLFLESGLPEPRESFALALAGDYLAAKHIDMGTVDVPGEESPLLRLGHVTFPRVTPNAGAYFGRKVGDYEILLDCRAPQSYDTVTFGEVLEKRIPAGAFQDAIVIVGVTTDSVKDYNAIPTNYQLRGPIQHAMIVNQLLRSALDGEPPTRWWPQSGRIAWIGLCTLLGGALGLLLRSPWKLAPALVLLLAAIVSAGWVALFHGLWIPITTPAIGAFAAATFVTSLAVFQERSQRRIMRTLFSRHVSKEVFEVLWAERDQILEGGRLKPHRVIATVLFTDLQGYTTIAEELDPPALMDWVNEYMSSIAPLVELHGGVVNSYGGDAIMAVFGGPIPHTREEDIDQDAVRAVRCALAMREELKKLNTAWATRAMPTVSMRVGIYTGPVVTGSIGSRQRMEYTALGDTTNTAARLQSLGSEMPDEEGTAPCIILIGDTTWQRLQGRFTATLVGPRRLKGKTREVVVHTVLSEVTTTPSE